MELNNAILILVIGMTLIVIMFVAVVLISNLTNMRVNSFKTYCDDQFEKISKQIDAANKGTKELTETLKQLNSQIKKF